MGPAQYGILLLVWSVTGILGVLQFGFGEATLRYVAYHYGEGNISGVNRGWFHVFGRGSVGGLIRSVGLPWALASVAFVIEHAVRDCFAEIT